MAPTHASTPDDRGGRRTGDLTAVALVRAQLNAMAAARELIGSAPPAPATLRGRAGGMLVQGVRRMLFWFIPQVDRFNGSALATMRLQARALEELALAEQSVEARLAGLERDRGEAAAPPSRREMETFRTLLLELGRLVNECYRKREELEQDAETRIRNAVLGDVRAALQSWEERQAKIEASLWTEYTRLRVRLDASSEKTEKHIEGAPEPVQT